MSSAVHFRAPDGLNETPVSAATPLPVTSTGGNADGSLTIAGADGTTKAAPANPVPSRSYGSANIAATQVTAGTSATVLIGVRTSRSTVMIANTTTTPVYIGAAGVTTSTGFLLPGVVGATITLDAQSAVYGVAGTSALVTVLELFG